ncbi:MAG TPA: hypothetical protein DCE56_29535 [Cyanobacteria bacterium UBA8553]|nr:hypothetical protein [Cyanobacteria bacterium UBA8553]
MYGKHPQTIATPTENGTIARSCSDRVLENPIVFSEPPLTRGEQAEPAYNRVQVSVVQGLEGTSSSLDAMEEPDRVSGKKDCAFAEIQIGKLAKVCADIPSLEPLNGRQGVIDLIGSGVCRLQFVDGGDFHYVPHRYLIVTGEGEITEPIQSLVFSDKISTKTGSRRGRVSKVRRFRNGIEKYEITWDTEEIITYTIEEMQVAGFMKIKRKVSNEG